MLLAATPPAIVMSLRHYYGFRLPDSGTVRIFLPHMLC